MPFKLFTTGDTIQDLSQTAFGGDEFLTKRQDVFFWEMLISSCYDASYIRQICLSKHSKFSSMIANKHRPAESLTLRTNTKTWKGKNLLPCLPEMLAVRYHNLLRSVWWIMALWRCHNYFHTGSYGDVFSSFLFLFLFSFFVLFLSFSTYIPVQITNVHCLEYLKNRKALEGNGGGRYAVAGV